MTLQAATDAALRVAERFGVPVVILAAVLWMTREAGTVLHDSVIVPVVRSHADFLESTREMLQEMHKTQAKQADTLNRLAESQEQIRACIMSNRGE